jgi:hypothetical protein
MNQSERDLSVRQLVAPSFFSSQKNSESEVQTTKSEAITKRKLTVGQTVMSALSREKSQKRNVRDEIPALIKTT